MFDLIKQEGSYLIRGIRNTRFSGITKRKFLQEIIANGVAAIIALSVNSLLQMIFVTRTEMGMKISESKILSKFQRDNEKISVSEEPYNTVVWILIFLVSLVVFTYVEQAIEGYFQERKKKV